VAPLLFIIGIAAYSKSAPRCTSRALALSRQAAAGFDLLPPVCGWFTEAFDTRDLKEAKSLFDGSAG
jgi:hypothetical protein